MRAIFVVFALAVAALSFTPTPGAAQPAETILLNGKILTLDQRSSLVQALAIRGDRIIATGASADIAKHADAKTRVIDLDGRAVIRA
jgi:predicted amidohydrolase YtcJ